MYMYYTGKIIVKFSLCKTFGQFTIKVMNLTLVYHLSSAISSKYNIFLGFHVYCISVLMINDAHYIFEEQKTFYCIQITTDFQRYKK